MKFSASFHVGHGNAIINGDTSNNKPNKLLDLKGYNNSGGILIEIEG
jgi:hypothetical protein